MVGSGPSIDLPGHRGQVPQHVLPEVVLHGESVRDVRIVGLVGGSRANVNNDITNYPLPFYEHMKLVTLRN